MAETLIWPEHDHRRARLHAALDIARAEPPRIVAGDLNDELVPLAAEAPGDATLVVFHSAVLPYLPPDARDRFTATVRDLDARWIANEGDGAADGLFAVTVDGVPVARAAGHGHTLHWLTRGTGRTTPGSQPP